MSDFSKITTADHDVLQIKEKAFRERLKKCAFGVSYLDDALTGIFESDLVLIGGPSGQGKTELAIHIAVANVLKGKKVYYFALEAEQGEIGARLAYKAKYEDFRLSNYAMNNSINYDRWISGELPDFFYNDLERLGSAFTRLSNLKIRYSSSDYTIDDFEKDMVEVEQGADLIVLDHLHYFDLGEDERNENAAYKKIVKTIRSHCLDKKIPVVLVSHVRKMDKRYSSIVPAQEDFHGSSDIVKISTKAITISTAHETPCKASVLVQETVKGQTRDVERFVDVSMADWEGYRSFMRVVKHRRNGSATRHIALLNFDHRRNVYSEDYLLGSQKTIEGYQSFLVSEDSHLPEWARGERRNRHTDDLDGPA